MTKTKIIKYFLSILLTFTFFGLTLNQNIEAVALTYTDNSATTFNGTYTNTQYTAAKNGLEVTLPNNTGSYDSNIKNAGSNASWNSISWTQPQLYGVEVPANNGADTGYTNNLSMASNQVYYKFNETGTGITNWSDSSGNAFNITQSGGVGADSTSASIFNRSWLSSGTSQQNKYSILPNTVTAANQSKYTVMFWIRPTTITNPGTHVIYEEAQGTGTGPRLSLRIVNGQMQFLGRSTDVAAANTIWVTNSRTLVINFWYHIVAEYDSTSTTNNLKLYVSGVPETVSLSVPTFPNTVNTTTKPRIGQTTAGNTSKFAGNIDDFATFTNRLLTDSEAQQIYSRGAWNVNLQARSCPTSDCSGVNLVGPTGSTIIPFVNNGSTSTNTVSLSATYFPINQYFSYKINYSIRITGLAIDAPTGATSSMINQVVVDYTLITPTPSISFAIRDSTDTLDTNLCNLNTVSPAATATCSYRLKVNTNAASGYVIYVQTPTRFTNGIYNIPEASIGSGSTGGSDISSNTLGTEKYGATISPGSITSGGSITTDTLFNTGSTNAVYYYYPSTTALIQANGVNTPAATDTINTVLVTHKLNITDTTLPGNYSTSIVYTVSPVF